MQSNTPLRMRSTSRWVKAFCSAARSGMNVAAPLPAARVYRRRCPLSCAIGGGLVFPAAAASLFARPFDLLPRAAAGVAEIAEGEELPHRIGNGGEPLLQADCDAIGGRGREGEEHPHRDGGEQHQRSEERRVGEGGRCGGG